MAQVFMSRLVSSLSERAAARLVRKAFGQGAPVFEN